MPVRERVSPDCGLVLGAADFRRIAVDGGCFAVRVSIRVKPGAGRTRVGGSHDGALIVAVTARAVDGKATQAALAAVAEALGVRRRDVTLVTGSTSRTKVVDVAPHETDEAEIAQRVAHLAASGAGRPPS